MDQWLIDEAGDVERRPTGRFEEDLKLVRRGRVVPYAVRVHDVVIHDNRKWFGDASIRLDSLVVHGAAGREPGNAGLHAATHHFARVADGDRLAIDASGLRLFYGRPRFFLDVFVLISRDTKDSEDLASLLAQAGRSTDIVSAVSTVGALTVTAPTAAAIAAAAQAAATLGDLTYRALRSVTSSTIGLYRASWLQNTDSFGEGRHPKVDTYRVKDVSFWYEVVRAG